MPKNKQLKGGCARAEQNPETLLDKQQGNSKETKGTAWLIPMHRSGPMKHRSKDEVQMLGTQKHLVLRPSRNPDAQKREHHTTSPT